MASVAEEAQADARDFVVHTDDLSSLFEHARHVRNPTDVVIAPVELHRRNLKLRLTGEGLPLDSYNFTGPRNVGSRILDQIGETPRVLDRMDRLSLTEDILARECEARDRFRMVLGGAPERNVKAVEQSRTEVEAITNYHPSRVRAFRDLADSLNPPLDVDSEDVLFGSIAVDRALRRRSSKVPSTGEILRRASRKLVQSGGDLWREAYPHVERMSVVGLSSLPATVLDFMTAVMQLVDVEIHLFFRGVTGRLLAERLSVMVVDSPGEVFIS